MINLLDRVRDAVASTYRVERELGHGGMASVFLAEDLKHHRSVAIKVLDPELAEVIGPDRFLREIEIVGRLQHPNILPLLDSGSADHLLFFVMPYIAGESLRQRLEREHQLPLEDSIRLTAEVADALGTAHRQGIVHRDIKPENILLSEGHAMVTDFGIARPLFDARRTAGTPRGTVIGTPHYMSPEQASEGDVGPVSDVYSLGCVLFEMLTGQPPFTGPTAESVLHQHLTLEPRRVTELRPLIPEPVATTVARALAKTPADRFPSAERFSEALKGVVGPERVRPNRILRVAMAAVAVIALAVTAILVTLHWRSRTPGSRSSVAILPFENLTGESALDYVCDGIAAEILGDLVSERLNVASRSSSWSLRGRERDARQIARELGVATVLEGSVQERGASLRVAVQLVDGRTGFATWSGEYERPRSELLRLTSEISAHVIRKLTGGASPQRPPPQRAATHSAVAYDYYLQARRYLDEPGDPHGAETAAALCSRAIALDPDFALAHAALSRALWVAYSASKDAELYRRAEASATRAVELDPTLLEARLARAQMYRAAGRYDESIAELTRILEINPDWDEAHIQLMASYRDAGDLAAAEASCQNAVNLRPGYWRNWNSLGATRWRRGDYEGAQTAFGKIVELLPDRNIGYEQLAAVALSQSRFEDAIAAYEQLPSPVEDGPLASNIGTAYFFARRLDDAERYYRLALRLDPKTASRWQNLGDLLVRRGEIDEARRQYRRALALVEEQLELRPDDRTLGLQRVLLLAKAADCDGASRALARLEPQLSTSDAQVAHSVARVHALCGRRDLAIVAVRSALELGFSARMIREEDEFASLARDSDFVQLTTARP